MKHTCGPPGTPLAHSWPVRMLTKIFSLRSTVLPCCILRAASCRLADRTVPWAPVRPSLTHAVLVKFLPPHVNVALSLPSTLSSGRDTSLYSKTTPLSEGLEPAGRTGALQWRVVGVFVRRISRHSDSGSGSEARSASELRRRILICSYVLSYSDILFGVICGDATLERCVVHPEATSLIYTGKNA